MRRVRGVLLTAFLFAMCGRAHAAPASATLPNGMRVVVSSEPGSGRAAAVLMVRAGDADDPPGAAGTARMLSRLLMEPANHRAPSRLRLAYSSGLFRSDVEPDVTAFSVVALPDDVAAALRALRLIIEEPTWNSTLTLRSVRREGEFERDDPPGDWQQDFEAWQVKAGIPAPPRPDFAAPDVADLRRTYERRFVPDRMVLAVCGDVSAEGVLAEARQVFDMQAARTLRLEARPPRLAPAALREPTGRYAFAGFPTPPATSDDAPAVEVIVAALGRGKTSSLFRRLREGEGTGYESGMVYPRRMIPSGAAVFALAPDRAHELARDLEALWRDVADIPEGGWRSARVRAAHAFAMQHQTARDRAWWLAFWELAGSGAARDATFGQSILDVTDQDIRRAALRWFSGRPVLLP